MTYGNSDDAVMQRRRMAYAVDRKQVSPLDWRLHARAQAVESSYHLYYLMRVRPRQPVTALASLWAWLRA